ncbi:MAG: hypothetical protein NTW85_00380, partial [Methylococcales bacterium]|nr:hypothetical protein [Methylococcales bacterium]
ERLDIFSKIVSSSFMEIFFQGGVFEDSIFPEFKISSLLFQKTVRTIDMTIVLIFCFSRVCLLKNQKLIETSGKLL